MERISLWIIHHGYEAGQQGNTKDLTAFMFPSEIRFSTTQQDEQEQTVNDTQTLAQDFAEISWFNQTLTKKQKTAMKS